MMSRDLKTWLLVVTFAIGMAWVESATVYYLRLLVDRIDPYQPNPLPIRGAIGAVELVREAATLVMLLTLGAIAGQTWQKRLAYTAIAFGVWDIFYYLFLRLMTAWPRSVFDWDILFLLPLPWWGPVLAPVSIALLMIVWGTLATQFADRAVAAPANAAPWVLSLLGAVLALYVFMSDSLHLVHRGLDATRLVLPQRFNWSLFAVALVLMAMPVVQIGWRIRMRRVAVLDPRGRLAG
ncbi:MAG: hypothetical protein WBC51_05855 [Vicinamibacterales bacterium]